MICVAQLDRKLCVQTCTCCFNSFNSVQSVIHTLTSVSFTLQAIGTLSGAYIMVSCVHNSFKLGHQALFNSLFTQSDTAHKRYVNINNLFSHDTLGHFADVVPLLIVLKVDVCFDCLVHTHLPSKCSSRVAICMLMKSRP